MRDVPSSVSSPRDLELAFHELLGGGSGLRYAKVESNPAYVVYEVVDIHYFVAKLMVLLEVLFAEHREMTCHVDVSFVE